MDSPPNDFPHMSDNWRQAIADAYLADENPSRPNASPRRNSRPRKPAATQAWPREFVGGSAPKAAGSAASDAFTQEYALSTEEGVALMCLAEACCASGRRDGRRLIRDKIAPGDSGSHSGKSGTRCSSMLPTWALMLTGRVIRMGPDGKLGLDGILKKLVGRSGERVIRQAITTAMRCWRPVCARPRPRRSPESLRGAIAKKATHSSFDARRTAYTAPRCRTPFASYRSGLKAIAAAIPRTMAPMSSGAQISVKLSGAAHRATEWVNATTRE